MNAAPVKIPDSTEQIRCAVAAAVDRKAIELVVLNLSKISDFTENFLICSGANERQVQAIAEAILRSLRDKGVRPLHSEGMNIGRWVLLDYGGDMVIHIFLDESRQFYSLERLWADGVVVTSQFVPDAAEGEEQNSTSPSADSRSADSPSADFQPEDG